MKKKFLIIISITMLLIMASPAVAKVYWHDDSPQKPVPKNSPNWNQPFGYGNSPYYVNPDYSSPYWSNPAIGYPINGVTITQPYQYTNWLPQSKYQYLPSPTYYGWVREQSGYNLYGMKRAQSPEFGEVFIPQHYIANNQGNFPVTNQPFTPYGYIPPAGNYQYNQQYQGQYDSQNNQNQYGFPYQPYSYGDPKTADQFQNWWDSPEWKEYERQKVEQMIPKQDDSQIEKNLNSLIKEKEFETKKDSDSPKTTDEVKQKSEENSKEQSKPEGERVKNK